MQARYCSESSDQFGHLRVLYGHLCAVHFVVVQGKQQEYRRARLQLHSPISEVISAQSSGQLFLLALEERHQRIWK
jgi:hypothetical protein